MPKRTVDFGARAPLLDIVSFGRRGPGQRDSITPAQRDQIARTVRRTPEVMIKVSGGGRSLKAVKDHIEYIDREGNLELETDEGDRLKGDDVAQQLIKDWDLDLVSHRRQAAVAVTNDRKPPRLIHNQANACHSIAQKRVASLFAAAAAAADLVFVAQPPAQPTAPVAPASSPISCALF
jgi:hypothetical protein